MQKLIEKGRYILDKLTQKGADAAQVSVAEGLLEEFNVDSGEFSLIRTVCSSSASMKALKDNKKGTAAVNDLSEEALDIACSECVELACSGKEDKDFTIASLTENKSFVNGPLSCEKEKFFDNIIRFVKQMAEEFPQITAEQIGASYSYGKQVLMNTNGVQYTEEDGCYSISIMFNAHEGDEVTSFNCVDFDFLEPDADIMELAGTREALENAVKELHPEQLDEKFCGTAVIMPQCMGDFIGVIFGFTGDYGLIEKTSPWCSKLGEKVADESFTLRVIPNDERIIGGENITSDGYIAENFTLIESGVLKSFSLSEYGARKTGLDRAPSTSGAVEIIAGEKSFADIIAGIDRGILVGRFSGGEPGANGDFSGVAKNSFLIKDGRIACPLRETMISGNVAEMIKNIVAISSDTVNDSSSVLPWIAFDGITVS